MQTSAEAAPIITGDEAIMTRNAPALAVALQEGWTFPVVSNRAGASDTDLSLLFQCISWKWKEGWDLLSSHWPAFKADYRIVRRVLASGWSEVLVEIIPQHFDCHDEDGAINLMVDLMQTVSNPNSNLEDRDIALCAKHMLAHGAYHASSFPGPYEAGDLRLSGHTLWTLAIRNKRWVLAGMVAPSAGDALLHPRFEEAMEAWFFSSYMRESPLHPEPSRLARSSLIKNGHLIPDWLSESHVPFLEQAWPLLLDLSVEDRKRVWESIAHAGEIGQEHLEVLASGLADGCVEGDEVAARLCQLMVDEGGSALAQAWNKKLGDPSISAADTWSISVRAASRNCPDPFQARI